MLDAFAAVLADRLKYEPGQRDMVVLSHEFGIKSPNNEKVWSHFALELCFTFAYQVSTMIISVN